jgi:glutamine synthetase
MVMAMLDGIFNRINPGEPLDRDIGGDTKLPFEVRI